MIKLLKVDRFLKMHQINTRTIRLKKSGKMLSRLVRMKTMRRGKWLSKKMMMMRLTMKQVRMKRTSKLKFLMTLNLDVNTTREGARNDATLVLNFLLAAFAMTTSNTTTKETQKRIIK